MVDSASASTPARRKAPPPKIAPTPKRVGAYRTIAEMAAELGVATHVLRFWESKFPHLQPMKAKGGRRFYNDEAAAVAGHIRHLLYTEKLTIRGAQAALGKQKPKAIAARYGTLTPAAIATELQSIIGTLEGKA